MLAVLAINGIYTQSLFLGTLSSFFNFGSSSIYSEFSWLLSIFLRLTACLEIIQFDFIFVCDVAL